MDKATIPSQTQEHGPAHVAHHELRTAENSAAYVLPKLQAMEKCNPHLTLLDVGAGPGTISITFAKLIPDGHVIGVDVNPDILPRARAVAETAGVKNIDFQQGDAKKLPFADATFDVTFCHQMLIHISEPWDALREMLRVTKPGGIVAAREGDYETECIWPELPGLSKLHKLAADMMSSRGGTPTAGRQLLSWALKAGVERSQISVSYSTWAYHTPSDRKTWAKALVDRVREGPLREKGLRLGLTTEEDIEEMIKDWTEWAEREDASLAMLHGEILIQR